MHFTIERKRFVKMLQSVGRKFPGVKKEELVVRIYACAARVFVEANGVIAGEESLVLQDGGCLQPLAQFLALVKSYSYKDNITVEADEHTLCMFTSTRVVTGYTNDVTPPATFVVGRVADTWLAGEGKRAAPKFLKNRQGEDRLSHGR